MVSIAITHLASYLEDEPLLCVKPGEGCAVFPRDKQVMNDVITFEGLRMTECLNPMMTFTIKKIINTHLYSIDGAWALL